MRIGLRTAVAAIAAVASLALALPAGASATLVGFTAQAEPVSECSRPTGDVFARTTCQVFYGNSIQFLALAAGNDRTFGVTPQPFSLLRVDPGNGTVTLKSFTMNDENEADDLPVVTPRRNTDYKARFQGNSELPAATSAPLKVEVGAELTIPASPGSGRGEEVGLLVSVAVPDRSLRGNLELRRCHRTKARSAASCARASSYTVISRRAVSRTVELPLSVSVRPRTYERYEIAFRPRSKQFTVTRQAFSVSRTGSGPIYYRPTARSTPFGNR